MAVGGVRVTGLSRVVRALQQMGLEVEDLKDAFSEVSQQGARLAASYAPKQSGVLAGSVRGNRAKSKATVAAGRARVPYAGPINYGWPKRNISGSGFMQKADKELQPFALRQLEKNIEAAIKRRGLN